MKFVAGLPPNWSEIWNTFGVNPSGLVFTWGDTVYMTSLETLSSDLLVHEQTHAKQQNNKPEWWWRLYLKDKEFRASQKLEAYHRQYQEFCKHYFDKNQRFRKIHSLALDMSSKIYGNCITYAEALKKIEHGLK